MANKISSVYLQIRCDVDSLKAGQKLIEGVKKKFPGLEIKWEIVKLESKDSAGRSETILESSEFEH